MLPPQEKIKRDQAAYIKIRNTVAANAKSQARVNKKIISALDEIKEIINKVKITNEYAEESLGLMLLAIKQNQFLHTDYPAQHGYPDMKIAGKHPAKYG
jgi:hypothetical protein